MSTLVILILAIQAIVLATRLEGVRRPTLRFFIIAVILEVIVGIRG